MENQVSFFWLPFILVEYPMAGGDTENMHMLKSF